MNSVKSINCLYLISTLGGGGAESQLYTFVKNALDKGIKPIICALKGGGVLEKKFKELDIRCIIIGGNNFLAHVSQVRKIVRNENVDIIHAHMSYADFVARAVKVLTGLPIIITQHGLGRWKKGLHILIDRWTAGIADSFIVVSNASRSIRISRERYNESKIHVIPNGVNNAFIQGREWSSDGQKLTIGTVARLSEIKCINLLISAFALVKKRLPDVCLEIVGDGPDYNMLMQLTKDLKVEDSIKFCGWQDNIIPIISKWHFFVLPSRSEDMPLSLLEAMGMGLVSIASNVGGIPDIITSYENGLLFEPGDQKSLESALIELLENSELCKKISKRANETISEKYSIDVTVDKNIDIYRKILKR